ncbi:MAG: hypothetical protein ABF968_15605 [Acetobacter sp.]|uniref:hypothetical protein n=1 Tax=Acetobacter sp. TaxID=440 RepID=UPI0039E76528
MAPPTVRNFNPEKWSAERNAFPAGGRDDSLHAAGLWFYNELNRLWSQIATLGFPTLHPALAYSFIAMVANKNEMQISKQFSAAIADSSIDTPFYALAALRFGDSKEGATTADMRRTSLIDTLGKAVSIAGSSFQVEQPIFGNEEMREVLDSFSDIYLLEFLWSRVLWFDWSLKRVGSSYQFTAPQLDRVAGAVVVAHWRHQMLVAEFISVYSLEWISQNSVLSSCWQVCARSKPGRLVFKAQKVRPGEGELSLAAIILDILEVEELGPYLDRSLPNVEGEEPICIRDIVEGWELLFLAANAAKRLLLQTPGKGGPDRLSLAIPIQVLVNLLENLNWSRRKCIAVIDFLTFKGLSKDGVWTKPLLQVGKRRLMLLTPLVSCNLLRVAELWAAEGAGEIFFAERGKEFEARLRNTLVKKLAERPWSDDAMVLETAWEPRIDRVCRDIDLLFRIGNAVFIGEIKIKRYPNSAPEVGRYLREFEKAADQLDIRLNYLRQNLQEVSKRTNYKGKLSDLRVVGFILSGTPFGSGMTVGNYPIIDSAALDFFFSNDVFLSMATLDRTSGYEQKPTTSGNSIELVNDDPAVCMLGYLIDPLHVRYAEYGLRSVERRHVLKVSGDLMLFPEAYIEPLQSDVETTRTVTSYLISVKNAAQHWARACLSHQHSSDKCRLSDRYAP